MCEININPQLLTFVVQMDEEYVGYQVQYQRRILKERRLQVIVSTTIPDGGGFYHMYTPIKTRNGARPK